MEIELFSLERLYVFWVILARMAAVVGSLPIFTNSQAAIRLRIGLAVALGLFLFPVLDLSLSAEQMTAIGFALVIVRETLLGLLIGFVTQLIFFAVQLGATVVGYQMGFSAANILDPQNQQQVPILSQFQNVFAILVFLVLDTHHVILRVMVRSYAVLPPGEAGFGGGVVPYLVEMAGEMFVLGLQLVAPILVVLTVSMFILGIMSRVFSQLQVFMLSFPINITLAMVIIGLSMELVFVLLEQEFLGLRERLFQMLLLV